MSSFMIVYRSAQGPADIGRFDGAYRQAVAEVRCRSSLHRKDRTRQHIGPGRLDACRRPRIAQEESSESAVIGVENGYPIGNDLKRVKEFLRQGRAIHVPGPQCNSQPSPIRIREKTQGLPSTAMDLSPLGREVIAEMKSALGMMVDLSHPSKGANMEAMRLSQAPVIASHSGGAPRPSANVSRNMDDEQFAGSQEKRRP